MSFKRGESTPPKWNMAGADRPVDLLQRFADAYGAEIEMDGRKGHFFLFSTTPAPRFFNFEMHSRPRHFTVSQFTQNDSSGRRVDETYVKVAGLMASTGM